MQTLTELIASAPSPAPSLPLAHELALITAAQSGDESASIELLVAYAPAIRRAVRSFARFVDAEEAHSEAALAFFAVLKTHDVAAPGYKNGSLAPHIAPKVREALWKLRASTESLFHVPGRAIRRYYELMQANGGDLTKAYLAAKHAADIDPDTLVQLHAVLGPRRSLTGTALDTDEDVTSTSYVRLVTSSGGAEDSSYDVVEDRILATTALRAMDDDEARVCELAYGFRGYRPLSDSEVAEKVGQSRQKVQRTRASGLKKGRAALGDA